MRSRRRSLSGFTLIETLLVLGAVTIAILGVLGAHTASASLNRTNHDSVIAARAIRVRMEEVAAADVTQVVALFDALTDNDPAGPGTAPGATFAVTNVSADSLGRRGTVELPLNSGVVREDVVDATLGMPRDLNGDGLIDALDHTTDFKILPVVVRLRWNGVNGDRETLLATVLYR